MSILTVIDDVLKTLTIAGEELAAHRAKIAAQDKAEAEQIAQQEKDLPPEVKEP